MTAIEWTDETWNPIRARSIATGKTGWHCEHASEGCRFCYAERLNVKPGASGGTGLAYKPGHLGKDVDLFLDEKALLAPLRWRRGRRVFVCSMTDLFADFVPDAWIDRIMAVIALGPQHQFQVLSKRSVRMRAYFAGEAAARIDRVQMELYRATGMIKRDGLGTGRIRSPLHTWPLPNLWLGVSVEDQGAADARIPDLLATPATVRFLSCEPLLGAVDLRNIPERLPDIEATVIVDALEGHAAVHSDHDIEPSPLEPIGSKIDWVICGGESGKDARPMHPDWARGLRDQCAAAGVPFFFKQWGEHEVSFDRDRDDPDWRNCGRYSDRKGQWLNLAGGTGFHGERVHFAQRVGKKAAGRLLDGVEHSGMPA